LRSVLIMANHKATKKAIRVSGRKRLRNRYQGRTMRNAYRELMNATDQKEASEKLPRVISMLDKMSKNNIIHKNKAANLKSQITKKVASLA